METLTADKGAVLKAYNKAKSGKKLLLENIFGAKTFQPNIMERIKCFEDVCKEMGVSPKKYICDSDDPDDIAANALRQSLLISRCFNADTKEEIDWSNSNQYKYFHVYVYSPSSGWSLFGVDYWHSFTFSGSRQAFLKREHAEYAWETFKEIYINLIK
ncbi:hypothetical protein [Flavobacterium denitrificans]|uniref:hypothetical protein n=1 Tax=Flavobacterium denitrificans TaxID=281361 RepID=UPI00041FA63A|nr:hypothetical protein [Flavobacterium denitrificans]